MEKLMIFSDYELSAGSVEIPRLKLTSLKGNINFRLYVER